MKDFPELADAAFGNLLMKHGQRFDLLGSQPLLKPHAAPCGGFSGDLKLSAELAR
jgi:hypothetical protein